MEDEPSKRSEEIAWIAEQQPFLDAASITNPGLWSGYAQALEKVQEHIAVALLSSHAFTVKGIGESGRPEESIILADTTQDAGSICLEYADNKFSSIRLDLTKRLRGTYRFDIHGNLTENKGDRHKPVSQFKAIFIAHYLDLLRIRPDIP